MQGLTPDGENPATEDRLPLAELMAKAGEGSFLRGVAELVMQLLMEADVDGLIPRSVSNALALRKLGAGRHGRTPERSTCRNGCRGRTLDTRLDSLQLRIPRPRQGSHFPPFLDRTSLPSTGPSCTRPTPSSG